MTKIISIIFGAMLFVGLATGCEEAANGTEGGNSRHSSRSSSSDSSSDVDSVADIPEDSVEDLFLVVVHDQAPLSRSVPDADILDAAHSTCQALDEGNSMTDIMLIVIGSGIPTDVGGAIVGAGISAFCPEYQDELDALDAQYG